jgi:predicted small secreted protein
MENGDEITIHPKTGQILGYHIKNNSKIKEGILSDEELLEKARMYIKKIKQNWNEDQYRATIHKERNQVLFEKKEENNDLKRQMVTNISIQIGSNGEMLRYSDGMYFGERARRVYAPKDGKITRKQAVKMIKDQYNLFSIYMIKAEEIATYDQEGKIEYPWLITVVPFGSEEHHCYFVNADTGEINDIYRFTRGRKNE